MTDSYLINLSFQVNSSDEAEAVDSRVHELAESLKAAGQVRGFEIRFARDWLAMPKEAADLRPAANKELTEGPPEGDDD